MTRSFIAISAGLLLALSLTGCGSGDQDIPEGYDEGDIRQPDETPTATTPGGGIPKPDKNEGG